MTKKCFIIRKIVGIVALLSFLFVLGVVGGIEHGEPLINMLYTIPALFAMFFCSWLLSY